MTFKLQGGLSRDLLQILLSQLIKIFKQTLTNLDFIGGAPLPSIDPEEMKRPTVGNYIYFDLNGWSFLGANANTANF